MASRPQALTSNGRGCHIQPHCSGAARDSPPEEWSDNVLVICSGRAVSSITLPDGRPPSPVHFYFPGDVVCASSLFERYRLRGRRDTDVNLPEIQRSEFKAFCPGTTACSKDWQRWWAEESERADQLALDLGRRRADERVARFILNLATDVEARHGRRPNDGFPLRQRHIADATGLTDCPRQQSAGRVSTSRMIKIHDRSLTIVDE